MVFESSAISRLMESSSKWTFLFFLLLFQLVKALHFLARESVPFLTSSKCFLSICCCLCSVLWSSLTTVILLCSIITFPFLICSSCNNSFISFYIFSSNYCRSYNQLSSLFSLSDRIFLCFPISCRNFIRFFNSTTSTSLSSIPTFNYSIFSIKESLSLSSGQQNYYSPYSSARSLLFYEGWRGMSSKSFKWTFCSVIVRYYKMADRKAKLLKKYLGEAKAKRESSGREGLIIRDKEQIDLNSSLSSDSASESVRGKRRVEDSDEEDPAAKSNKKGEEEGKKSKTVTKGLRKALGLKKGEDVDEFVTALKIEGVDMAVIEEYLKSSKEGLRMEKKKEKKEKKKKEKEKRRVRDSSPEEKPESEGSDLDIPEQARTIYRDKQGRIKEFSEAKEKELKEKQVLDRLAEWEKGMKNDEQAKESEEEIPGIWDDPARRWESTLKHPLRCPYQGYANRFNIKPGFRWDGVIRGNNFETKYLQEINLRKAKESQEQREYLKNL